MSENKRLKEAMRRIGEEYIEVYNCDPSQKRGYHFDGTPLEVPPLGHDGNPVLCTKAAGLHIISHSRRATPGVRYWLTDEEGVYNDCLNDLEEKGYVVNPHDPNVVARPPKPGHKVGSVLVQKQEDYEKRQQAEAEAEFQEFLSEKSGVVEKKAGAVQCAIAGCKKHAAPESTLCKTHLKEIIAQARA